MVSGISGKYAIVGIGETEVGKLHGRSVDTIHMDAMKAAVEDAGLQPAQVDGLLTNQPINDFYRSYASHLAALGGLQPTYATDLGLGGATPAAMAQHAAMAIDAGMAETVLCVHGRKPATGKEEPFRASIRNGAEDFEHPFNVIGAPAQHAAVARRHMHEFGTTSEQLAAIAIAARKHASLNANATMRDLMTVEEHQASRWIVKPFRLLDCCLVSDGGGAFVVTSAERAKDMPQRPVYILGMGQHHPRNSLMEMDPLTTGGGAISSQNAYRMAGLGPEDMQFAQFYDCFTMTTLITIEDYGFCPKGDGGPWVQGGRIEVGGELPVNTHGGLLSQAHVEGMLHVTEAVKQLRGGAVEPERQVEGAEVGIVSGHGGAFNTHATLILASRTS